MKELATGVGQAIGYMAVFALLVVVALTLSGDAAPDAEYVLVVAVGVAIGWLGYAAEKGW